MKKQEGISARAETVFKLSRAILSAASEGRRDDVEKLADRRADLIERMFGAEAATGDRRIFLAGVMAHVRKVDAATRECLDRDGGWPGRAGDKVEWRDGEPVLPIAAPPKTGWFGGPRDARY